MKRCSAPVIFVELECLTLKGAVVEGYYKADSVVSARGRIVDYWIIRL